MSDINMEKGLANRPATAILDTDLGWIRQNNQEEDSVFEFSALKTFLSNNLKEVVRGGTAYTLTATSAQIVLGGGAVELSIDKPGTYLVNVNITVEYVGATFAAVRNFVSKLRRNNNTAGDITNSSRTVKTSIVTTETSTLALISYQVIYTATTAVATTPDDLELWASISTLPSAGTLQVTAASLQAIRLVG